jgi:hypothetical protein
MARSSSGWVVLNRQILKHWLWQDAKAFQIWTWLVMNANYDDSKIFWKGQERILKRGQILTTAREIARECYCSKGKVDRTLIKLKTSDMIEPETKSKGSIITILNYRKYNDMDFNSEPETEPEFGKESSQNRARIEPIRTIKQENKKTIISIPPKISDFGMDLGTRWLAFGLQAHPQYASKWTVEKFGEAIDEVIRKGPFTPEQIEDVFNFIQADPFWKVNARSPANLLKKSQRNGMRKIDNIVAVLPEKKASFYDSLSPADREAYFGIG